MGCKVVWSLSSSGQLYRLRGLAAGNPAGNYWKVVPIRLRAMSVDSKEHLWGIDNEGRLVSHAVRWLFSSQLRDHAFSCFFH